MPAPRLLALVAFAASSIAIPAFAQTEAASTSYAAACSASSVAAGESERAHVIYQAGKVQYDDANYDAAIAQFREAYKRDCSKHELLVIISRAYELKQDRGEAIRALELYLAREPSSPDAATHRNRIENLRKQLAATPLAPSAPADPAPSTAPPPEDRGHTLPPWIVVGVGGVALATGAILLVAAPSIPPNCDSAGRTCTFVDANGVTRTQGLTSAEEEKLAEDGRTAGRSVGMTQGGVITMIGGGVLVLGGLLWHFLEPTGSASSSGRPKVLPAVSPGYAGVALGGAF